MLLSLLFKACSLFLMIFKILNLVQIMLKACFFFFCILAVEFVKGGDWLLELVEGTMGSSFNAQILVEKLSKLNNSQASIESILSIILNCSFFFFIYVLVSDVSTDLGCGKALHFYWLNGFWFIN